ncbi:archaeal heat shock protein Hsp20 [Candidatus Nitrosotenuis sp. DW1]|uniref:archaeal heat shock protein Hsp20 n=1 Tax=Candidatus Nitrosotenuis sp. DW1 TaxID=2259672 RepID=UPI0015CA95FA|nr:archaeal heat shock protein Hsp20 [Candidatus Nitrosotenuis sp. DW1]QLH09644.1 Hsp20/alpha crystallin family protein [Candidatus Nitrosotenuis sp. DW1]
MWFDNQLDQMFRSLSDRFFNMDDDFELAKYAFTHPYSYGYSMIMGNNGRPLIRHYGTPVPGLITSDVREPFVDEVVDKSGNTLKLVAEMPGVDKKDIKVTIEGKYAKISAEHGERKYQTQIPLKYKVDENSTKATYANGILEVSFRLIEQKPKGKAITID